MSIVRVLRLAPVCLALFLFSATSVAAQSPAEAQYSAALESINELDVAKLGALLDKNPTLVKPRNVGQDADTLLHQALRRGVLPGGTLTYQESASLISIVRLLVERNPKLTHATKITRHL